MNTLGKVVFVTARQLGHASVAYARDDGYRPVIVPDDIARALSGSTDLAGNPMFDLRAFQQEWNDSFTFSFVAPSALTKAERRIHDLIPALLELADIDLEEHGINEILVSETMRLDEGGGEVIGVWDASIGQIVIRRDQLATAASFCGTLLHELEHAVSGAGDCTFAFEAALTERLGVIAESALLSR
jgi:hypothetical protein